MPDQERNPQAPAAAHLEPEQIAAFVDDALDPAALARAQAHLAACAGCRADLVAVRRAVAAHAMNGTRHGRRKLRWAALAPLAAAAAAAFLLLVRPAPEPGVTDHTPLRDATAAAEREGVGRIEADDPAWIGPEPGRLRWSWRPAEPGALYRFALMDEEGDFVWTETTTDTVLAAPATVELEAGRTYYWYLDALLSGARSVTSGVRELRVPD